MPQAPKQPDQLTPEETARRRDEALRRALNTPHKPHKPIGQKSKGEKHGSSRAARSRNG